MIQVLLQATVWEAGQCLSLFRRCVKPYVYAVFLQLPCESIPSRQRFHLEDKLITAREFNAHVRPGVRVQYAHTILMTKLASHTLYAVHRVQSEVYFVLKSSEPSTIVLWETLWSFWSLKTSNIACIAIQKFGSVREPDYLIKNTVKQSYFAVLLQFKTTIFHCNMFFKVILFSSHYSSVCRDPSEISLICWFDAQSQVIENRRAA